MRNYVSKLYFLIWVIMILNHAVYAQSKSITKDEYLNNLNNKIPAWLDEFVVPGAAIAIIDNGEVILQKGYGYADVKNNIKVNDQTGFNIGSISKTVAAWGIMKLVEEGKVELDSPVEKYLTRWHFPKSEYSINKVTIRRLLSHTSGLSLPGYPGWSPSDTLPTIEESLSGKNNGPGDVRLIMEPGTKWKYSGGGFTILQLVIEEVTGLKFADFMQAEILNPLGMVNSSYIINEKILDKSSLEHNNYGAVIPFELFTAKAAAGLHTTIEDFAIFAQASLNVSNTSGTQQSILKQSTIELMTSPVPASDGKYGLGYHVDSIPNTSAVLVGHGGANTGWHAFLQVNQKTGDGFAMITNGGSGHNVYRQAYCDWINWKLDVSLGDRCKKIITPLLIRTLINEGIASTIAKYKKVKTTETNDYLFFEGSLNRFGYELLRSDKVKEAIEIFKLNVEEYPESGNVYDSLGEAYMVDGNSELAIKNYEKSIELDSDNVNGIEMLKKLKNK
ncbi:serine hydrolase [Flavivirga jejuensis]|uniref:Serine hydrolase n=1 Tax=Flavivirga jejuensis TaxID=870487 RepID=A0ABT8WQC1_9FLAO|nr:serine hydrolase [Flavivirga jejuensis]MDO5975377.1 serine hydrolase [Flavivirga jejuensis]